MTNTFELDLIQHLHELIKDECESTPYEKIISNYLRSVESYNIYETNEALGQYGLDIIKCAYEHPNCTDEADKIVYYATNRVINRNYWELEWYYAKMVTQLKKGEQ